LVQREGARWGYAPNEIFGECNWTSVIKVSDYMLVVCQKLRMTDAIIPVTSPPSETPDSPLPRGGSSTSTLGVSWGAGISEGGRPPKKFCQSRVQICSFWHKTNIITKFLSKMSSHQKYHMGGSGKARPLTGGRGPLVSLEPPLLLLPSSGGGRTASVSYDGMTVKVSSFGCYSSADLNDLNSIIEPRSRFPVNRFASLSITFAYFVI